MVEIIHKNGVARLRPSIGQFVIHKGTVVFPGQPFCLGFQAAGKPDGDADCYLDFGLVFADLLKEDGAWKLWHLVLEHDHTVTVGEHYEDLPVLRDQYTDPLEEQNGTPTIQTPVYQPLFGWEYMWQDMPKPYYTYSETESYGPGGNLGKPYYERERR